MTIPAPSRSASAPQARPNPARRSSKEPAHLPLHRRLLFPYDGIEKALPKIIEGQGAELDLLNERIYHLLALLLRSYVLSWYPRLSPRDRSLLPHITHALLRPVLNPILNSIYQDPERLVELVLLDIPSVLGLHVGTYWQARRGVALGFNCDEGNDQVGHGGGSSGGQLAANKLAGAYHARLPLLSVSVQPFVSPNSSANTIPNTDTKATSTPTPASKELDTYTLSPLYLTSLADSLLRHHLPLEQYASPAQRLMARELLGRVVLGGIGRRLSQGWFWWGSLLRLLGDSEPNESSKSTSSTNTFDGKGPNGKKVHHGHRHSKGTADNLISIFVRIYTTLLLLWKWGTTLATIYTAAPPIPKAREKRVKHRYRRCLDPTIYLVREILRVGDPEMGTWAGRMVCGVGEVVLLLFGPVLDRILPHLIRTHLLTPHASLRLCDLIEHILFPIDGYPGETIPDPTELEEADMKERLERRLRGVIPAQRLFFRDRGPLNDFDGISNLLAPLGNPGCNAHMVGMLLDTVVAGLVPEMVVGHGSSEVQGNDQEED